MTTYNFKRDSKVYVVYGGLRYNLDVYPDLSFSQTFNETNVPVKTLHSQYNMFEKAVITRANPANFNFTVPLLYETDLQILLNLLTNYNTASNEATVKSADIYVETNTEVYKLEKAVFETGTFTIARDSIIVLSLAGSARKLSKYTDTIPGTLQPRTTRTYSLTSALRVQLGGDVLSSIAGISIELQNGIQWVDYTTLHNSIGITGASDTMYPEVFVVGTRVLSGNIQQYVTNETNDTVNTWEIGVPLNIKVGNSSSQYLLEFDIPSIVYTNRLDTQELYTQSFDFRMDSSPTDVSQVIKHL